MKKLKLIFMVMFIMLLSGCGSWSDVQEKYGDLLNKNISCTYYTEETSSNNDYYGISTMKFSADYNGFYLTFNGTNKNILYDNNGSISYFDSPNGMDLLVNTSFLEDYLKKYLESNSCPTTVYINRNNNDFSINSCEGLGTYCDSYVLKQNQVKNDDGELVDCHYPGAVACKKKVTNTKPSYYLEFGYYKKSDGTIDKYFGVSTDKNYKNMETGIGSEFMVYENLTYFVITEEAVNEIYLGNNKFMDMSKIVIKSSYVGTTTYYITGPNSTNYGDISEIESEDAPNIDSDHSDLSEKNYEPQEDLEITPVSICSSDSTSLLVFQVIGYIIKIIKGLVPVILVILGSIDLGKASISHDENALKEAVIKFCKKILIGLTIFFIPTILDFFLSLVSGTSEIADKFKPCTDCVLNPDNSNKCSPKKLNQ